MVKCLRIARRAAIGLIAVFVFGGLLYSHCNYSRRAEEARKLKSGETARAGRIFFVSFPANRLAVSIFGWHPNVGHASLVTRDRLGVTKQYDYGWFVGYGGQRPADAIGYVDASACYGVVRRKTFNSARSLRATNDLEIAKMVLDDMRGHGDVIEIWGKDVDDVGIAERYMEQLAEDKDRGSMGWRCWQVGGYRCGNITRQAFDAARGEGHYLDLVWGGFPGADAPSIGTEKTVFRKGDDLAKKKP